MIKVSISNNNMYKVTIMTGMTVLQSYQRTVQYVY